MSLEKKSIAQLTADKIKQLLDDGYYLNEIPGKATIAKELGVGVNSVAAAFTLLENIKYLHPAEKGKPRKVRAKRSKEQQNNCRTLFIITPPLSKISARNLILLDSVKRIWQQQVEGGAIKEMPIVEQNVSLEEMRKAIVESSALAIFIFEFGKTWVPIIENLDIPFFKMGGVHETEKGVIKPKRGVTGLGYNIADLFTAQLSHLHKMGHRVILIPLISDYLRAGIEQAFKQAKLINGAHSADMTLKYTPLFPISDQATWDPFWQTQLTNIQPTAIICIFDSIFFSLYSFTRSASIKIPQHLSIISLQNSPQQGFLSPKIAAPTMEHTTGLKIFKKWITSDFEPQGYKSLSLKFDYGDSVLDLTSDES